MAFDFFIGDLTESVPPALSLPEQMHTQLFRRADELRRLPLLGRMADFYSDVSYEGVDLWGLIQELQQIMPAFAGRPQMQAILRQLHEVSQTAITQERGLYGFCD
ncbi:MAG: hypothetical protein V4812_18620 [Pseudomonadota bacterium]